ncbi:MAG: diguanylate cyclase [Anaerolineales bacterium]
MTTPVPAAQSLTKLRTTFLTQLPELRQQIEAAWLGMIDSGWSPEAMQDVQYRTHRLAGSAFTLGYQSLGRAARELELALAFKEWTAPPQDDDKERLKNLFSELLQQITHPCLDGSMGEEELITSLKATESLQFTRANRLVFLVEDDPEQAEELAVQIRYFGYQVQILTRLEQLGKALQVVTPAAILMDLIFPEGDSAGIEAVQQMRSVLPAQVPVIFVSVRDDFQARLQAVRAGGQAYFTKPVNIGALIDALDRMTLGEEPLPYRVLIVDDSPVQANFSAMHLKKAGMETYIVTTPLDVLQALNDFNPDLILLDLYMPECSGFELAQSIRQIETFISIPIVYLSAETDREVQLEAVGIGGDDFLTKPIKPDHLIASIRSRVERYRQMRNLIVRDSLTGLLNHTTIKERLSQELSRAIRYKIPLAFAMLDIDHFKQVNDTYGHSVGDRVLKNLARLLVNRLRTSDIVGRYGGEEFAIIFPNTSGNDAVQVLDEIRQNFSGIVHQGNSGQVFHVTFSAGIAAYPGSVTPANIGDAADRALYQAKAGGRNRVVLLSNP